MSLHTALIQTDEKKISPEEAKKFIASEQNGAESIFIGKVRNENGGKKVLASDVPGIRDILVNFPDCLIEPGNVNALFKKLKNLINDIKNGINNNNNVSQYIREHYDISVESKRHEKIYKQYFNH